MVEMYLGCAYATPPTLYYQIVVVFLPPSSKWPQCFVASNPHVYATFDPSKATTFLFKHAKQVRSNSTRVT